MIVREVRLENVKSYGSPAEVVRLNRGVNAICGQNGSGKSTILEAIGCALFLHLPYRHQDFVREGESSGTITVVVESRLDQRTYDVVRKVGSGAAHYVYDPDIRQQIARGEADVRRWLHQHLRIDEEVDLRSLFLDSVGPPQGTLTAVFLESPQERRSKFDRLLRVAEYEEAFRRLSALDAAFQAEEHEIEMKVAGLEPLTQARAALESELAGVRDRKYQLAVQLRRCVAERAAIEREIEAFASAEQRWRNAQESLNIARERERSATENLDRARAEYRRAAEAHDTCVRCRRGHETYVEVVERLQSLEADQRERDQLRANGHRLALEIQRLQSEVNRLDSEIARAEQAARDAAELQKKIPEQEAAEKRLQAARDARTESDQIKKRIASLERQVALARDRVQQAEKEVAFALEQHPIADELPARRARHQNLANERADANRAEGELTTLRKVVLECQQRASRVQKQIEALDAQLEGAAGSEELAATLAAHEAEQRSVAGERSAALSHLEHARATRQQVAGGLCPFLHEACQNLRPGVTLETHFDEEIRIWSARVAQLDRRLDEVDELVRTAREAQAKVAVLPQIRRQRDQLDADLKDNAAQLAESRAKLQEVARLATRKSELELAEQAAQQLVREAERAAQEVARLATLRKALDDARAALETAESELDAARKRIEELQDAVADLPAAAAALNALGGPREQVGRLLAEATKLGGLQAQRRKAADERDRAAARAAEIDRLLAPYHDLDERLDALRSRRDQCRADHDAYLAADGLARALDDRSKALDQAEAQASTARAEVSQAQRRLDEAARSYDQEAHRRAVDRRGELDTSIGDVQARMDEADGEEGRLNSELDRVQQYELELATHRRRLEQIEEERQLAATLRQAIRAAGPEITRQILSRISRMASRINAEILNQSGVELEWTDTYEIVTKRHGETRGFAQLSGGEQMAAALAVRLAILRDLSNVRVAFLDEPTAHLDQERRANLGEQVQRLQGFDQLVVISHDDTFDGLFGHVIRIGRDKGRSRVLDES